MLVVLLKEKHVMVLVLEIVKNVVKYFLTEKKNSSIKENATTVVLKDTSVSTNTHVNNVPIQVPVKIVLTIKVLILRVMKL